MDYTSSLVPEIERIISVKALSKLSMLENFYCKELNCLNYYETLALKIKNKLEDLRNLH